MGTPGGVAADPLPTAAESAVAPPPEPPIGVLVHEWIEPIGGSENVFEALASMFPRADLLCAWNNAPERFPNRLVRETGMRRWPLRGRKPLALVASLALWRRLPYHYESALVSSHAFAHQVSFAGAPPEFRKYVYVHSPARYLWNPELDPRGRHPLARAVARPLRGIDRRRARECTSIVANSRHVAERLRTHWERTADVIPPPVEVSAILAGADWADRLTDAEGELLASLPERFLLGASRWTPYKRMEVVLETAEAAGLPAVIAGAGPQEQLLRSRARGLGVPVSFVVSPSDALLRALYQRAAVFCFPAIEDFGIMPVEAMACGTPVVASTVGGAGESVVDAETGVLVADWRDPRRLREAVRRATGLSAEACRRRALDFDRARFEERVTSWIAGGR